MPLVRVEVRNEYGLGMPELYTETNREDPKAVLDGVTVAGLVGILRQLGDLSEFAAEVFHGIEEQVLITSSRIHKLEESLYNIEAALPPLEKAILAQGSHLHFAYTSGSRWHTRSQTEQNHFIYSDLPKCIMDSYEDCHDPPRLHKLDKFDTGGRGSCFKRYSDPTYFKRASTGSYGIHLQSITREKKARRSKKKKSLSRHRDMTHEAPIFSHGSGMDFASPNSNTKASSLDVSTIHVTPKSITEPETEYHLTSFDSRNGSGYIDRIFHPSYSTQSEENKANEPSSDSNMQQNSYLDPTSLHENVENSNLQEHSRPRSSFITWDEKLEIVKSTEISCTTNKLDTDENEDLSSRVDLIDFDFHDERLAISVIAVGQPDEIESETDYYLDSLNIIESEPETDEYCHTKSICSPNPKQTSHESPNNETEHSHQATSHQIICTPSISSTSTDDIKSEKDEITDTNIAILSTREATNSVMFWTNGGLLGLAPSKPPDFDSATESKDGPIQDSSQEKGTEDDEHIGSSRIFEFSNRLLVNGFRRQKSLVPENPSIPAMVKPFEEQFGSGSPSSPPLEHMKISFQLIDGFETCTLKLNCHESMFPSFQLVPEYDISLHELDLDSEDDDDTFFRSSQYASDECLSHRSESNSEQWDSGDSLETSLDQIVSRVDEKQGVKPHPNHKNVETQNESNCIDCMKVVAEKEDFLQQIRKKAV